MLSSLTLTTLLLTALHSLSTLASTCIKLNEDELCCPGSLFGGVSQNNEGLKSSGICCIDPSSVNMSLRTRNIIAADDISDNNRRRQNINIPTTCREGEILVPLTASDYSERVSSIVASATSAAATTATATATMGTASPTSTSQSPTSSLPSTGGMPAATGRAKATWRGCGQHIPRVMEAIPADQWCTCTPKTKVDDKEYPPRTGEGKAAEMSS
ncbi:hypothetical protein AJ79_00064 [Helicocarpus griseus UAMH5409]|uniref:Hydrophobin n=1 Tax=Helicocarpus griseus UAMH5409 TaxID=1447875 RepID=A0A2B7YCW1_9EURO|nr:hypothetical protein AJ79_00064 [Helicocarpus griseus UAMH5409]